MSLPGGMMPGGMQGSNAPMQQGMQPMSGSGPMGSSGMPGSGGMQAPMHPMGISMQGGSGHVQVMQPGMPQQAMMTAQMNQMAQGGAGPPQINIPPAQAPPPQQPNTEALKYDNVAKVKSLVFSLKEALSNVIRVAAANVYHTAALDNGIRTTHDDAPPRLDKTLEDFFSICNQIELNLRTIHECTSQLRDSNLYLPVPVNTAKSDSNPQDTTLSYSQYIATIRSQVHFAKQIQEILNESARQLVTPE